MADIFERAERLMGMTDEVWMRHASPWSVWTRVFLIMPALTLAIWSRVWLGWRALVPVALVLVFTWLNPRLFPAPERLDRWSSHGVLGERVWLRHRERVAAHHVTAARVLTLLSGLSILPWLWGVVMLQPWPALSGMVLTVAFKMWFVDRMVWIWHDFQRSGGTLDDLKG